VPTDLDNGLLTASEVAQLQAQCAELLMGDIITTWNEKPVDGVREVMRFLGPDSAGNTVGKQHRGKIPERRCVKHAPP
jgi:hypothetical protein